MSSNQLTNTINVITVLRSGGEYQKKDVVNLYKMIDKHHRSFNFYCLTDHQQINQNIKVIPLKHRWKGWWSKIELFRFSSNELFLYMDLDTVVTGNFEHFFNQDVSFSPIYDAYQYLKGNHHMGSGLFLYKPNQMQFIYNTFKERPNYYMNQFQRGGDQRFIESVIQLKRYPMIQDLFPNQIFSFKADLCDPPKNPKNFKGIPKTAKVVFFHGKPRPKDKNYLGQLEGGK